VPFAINLVSNLLFMPIFAGLRIVPLACLDILIVWATIVWCVVAVWRLQRWVALAQGPYFMWVSICCRLLGHVGTCPACVALFASGAFRSSAILDLMLLDGGQKIQTFDRQTANAIITRATHLRCRRGVLDAQDADELGSKEQHGAGVVHPKQDPQERADNAIGAVKTANQKMCKNLLPDPPHQGRQ
jgi:hypothetical protein